MQHLWAEDLKARLGLKIEHVGYKGSSEALRDVMAGHVPLLIDLLVPSGPGLGVEIDERVIEKYPFIPGPWSFFRIDSPPETVAVTGDHSVKWVAAPPA